MVFNRPFPSVLAVLSIVIALMGNACADTLGDINKLIKEKQYPQALEQVEGYLAGKPKDAQGRFLKGLILTELNRPNEAISIFQKLTEDYPDLPEPYNNLAVIYAQQKQFEKAKQALETAIRTHPAYATAHENLGDIYTRLASQAYDKALQIDSSNTSAQTKLSMVRELMGTSGRQTRTPTPVKPAATVAAIENKPPVGKPEAVTEPKPVETKPKETNRPAIEATPEIARPADAKNPAKASSGTSTAEIAQVTKNWAAAWSRKDPKAYLSFYARNFKTPNGEPRSAWETDRKQKITKPGIIQVELEDIQVSVDTPDKATVRFRQHYRSANLKTSSHKSLLLTRQEGRWMILQERIGK